MSGNIPVRPAYWTPDELAPRLNVDVQTIRRLCRNGWLPARKVGPKLWRISETVIRERYPELFGDTTGPAA